MNNQHRAMTLVELVVVVAIIGALVALLLPAVLAARGSARATTCKSQMRQIGLAILQYCSAYHGRFPDTVHAGEGRSWIYTLAPHLEHIDEIRICREDPIADERLRDKSTSYVISDYVALDGKHAVRNINQLRATSKTIIVFEGSDKRSTAEVNEHAHASKWFSNSNILLGLVTWAVEKDIQPSRHGPAAHYLYADGHVDTISAAQISQWIAAKHDFAKPE
jgi:prepilin-type N-terminal cleavage/methylation domain-containing protein/prepilin-type processing-associated H-X9-DG protein